MSVLRFVSCVFAVAAGVVFVAAPVGGALWLRIVMGVSMLGYLIADRFSGAP